MYQEYNYLIHSKGPWKKNTKYKKKVKVNGVWKYIYTDNFLEADRFEDEKGTYKETENGVRIRVDDEKPLGHFKYSSDQDIAYDVRRLSRDISDNVKDKAKSFERLQEAKDDVARAYKDQQDAAERRGKIIAEAYADQKKKEKKSMTHGADTEGYSYLIHSAKGSTWSKKNAKYLRKYKKNGRWYYIYGRDQKTTSESVDEMRDADREKRRKVAKAKKAIRNTASDTVSNLHETLSNNKAEAQRKRRENFKEDFRETVDRATKVSNAKKAIRNAAAEKVEAKRTKSRQHLADMFEEAYNEASRKPKKNHFSTRR